ncbi:hypothetical protein SAMN03159341_102249 [Paenibacillus sp. 1_12]|uniref:YHYH domain-containing protein n=1 Tax=Paenibacillus sp. 1_12 TaxID=1566278 RepID=UPI0008ECA1FF|nr:YHYH domain-containing protein [Paenibacillus sp. 1_12]SFK93546.1 hypothetical protein SAMN03159341_102249 [Paenibacillus sp. 1_12]
MKVGRIIILTSILALSIVSTSFAHPGRLDSNGGHNCSAASVKKGLCTGYHYHNGSGGSSSSGSSGSSSSSNSSSKPASAPPKEVVPAGQLKVTIPAYKVYVNNQQVFSNTSKYPVFEYKDITYFPMTYNFTQALGLETNWDDEVGFSIRKTSNKAGKLSFDSGVPTDKLYAKMPDFNIFVNDDWLDNGNEEYPILVLNDVTYFPMTWNFAVEEFGLTTKLENNAFYISK